MGFLDDLLTGSSPSLETRSLSTIDPTQRDSLNALIARLSGQANANPSDQVAPLGASERMSLAALEERSKALALPDAAGNAASSSVQKLLDFEGQTADSSAYFKSNVEDPMLRDFSEKILPQISRQFGGADFFSSERQASEGMARNDLLKALTASKTSTELDQFNKSRDRALTAAGTLPGLAQAGATRTAEQAAILEALGLPRQIEQAGIDKAGTKDKERDAFLAQLGLTPTIENIGMTDPGNAGLINVILGGAAGGLGDMLGGGSGSWLTDLLGQLFGNSGGQNPNGGSPADGSTVITEAGGALASQLGGASAGIAGGAAGAGATGAGLSGATAAFSQVAPLAAAGFAIADIANHYLDSGKSERIEQFVQQTGIKVHQKPYGKMMLTIYEMPGGNFVDPEDVDWLYQRSKKNHESPENREAWVRDFQNLAMGTFQSTHFSKAEQAYLKELQSARGG